MEDAEWHQDDVGESTWSGSDFDLGEWSQDGVEEGTPVQSFQGVWRSAWSASFSDLGDAEGGVAESERGLPH